MSDIRLRHFNQKDCDFIAKKLWPDMEQNEISDMIREWERETHDGVYFETFVIANGPELVGFVSLFEMDKDRVHLGAIIIPEFRYHGIAFEAITQALPRAREKGYKKIAARVLKANTPSLNLCKKLGLEILGEDITADGKPILILEKPL